MKLKARYHLRSDFKEKILDGLKSMFGPDIEQFFVEKKLEIAETDEYDFILVNGDPMFFMLGERLYPTLRGVMRLKLKKKRVIVDMGAVKFVSNGADIMCPGIINADTEIQKGDIVIVSDEVHGKPIAIGIALISGEEMMGSKGKAIKSVHYVGDKIWKFGALETNLNT
ncbi:MAG: RNA-binding protein [Methanocellales archaeon]|nr:RNA-binding protein [Methanocellales archaeon]